MIRALTFIFCVASAPIYTLAADLPPGVKSARLLSGWTDETGTRFAALELNLEPGWKTYWRNPGGSGLPPSFDWSKSENLAVVTMHWPTPEVVGSGHNQTLGYHDMLVLPVTAVAIDAEKPIVLKADIALGVCDDICVPVFLSLTAQDGGSEPDPVIEQALSQGPEKITTIPPCRYHDIEDGVQLSAVLPDRPTDIAAMEIAGSPEIWTSTAILEPTAEGGILATADFIAPSGEPFDLDPSRLLITQIGPDGAVEMHGCQPKDVL